MEVLVLQMLARKRQHRKRRKQESLSGNEEKCKQMLRELAGEEREARNIVKRRRPDLLLGPLFRCPNDFVGAGWHGMANHDRVVVLFSCNVPGILRSHGGFSSLWVTLAFLES